MQLKLKHLLLLAPLALLACDRKPPAALEAATPTPTQPKQAKATIDVNNPASCQACHAHVYQEWTESMHSRAHHAKDPIYGSMRSLRMKKQGEHLAAKCAKCHNPRSPSDPDTPAGMAGVSCASCHNVAAVHAGQGKVGVDALTWEAKGVLRSARDRQPGASPVHGTGPALPALKDGVTLCLACHDSQHTPAGAPACTTGSEFREAGTKETCVSCHMPTVKGPVGGFGRQEEHVSHAFLGPHRAWYQGDTSALAASVELSASFDAEGLAVTLKNVSAHSFPSGFPGRTVLVKVVGLDAAGNEVWTNYERNPLAEAPNSVLNKVYHDAKGEPAPAPFAKKLVRDTRLGPAESRLLRYEVPQEAVRAQATIVYYLLPPALASKLGLSEALEAEPRKVVSVEARR